MKKGIALKFLACALALPLALMFAAPAFADSGDFTGQPKDKDKLGQYDDFSQALKGAEQKSKAGKDRFAAALEDPTIEIAKYELIDPATEKPAVDKDNKPVDTVTVKGEGTYKLNTADGVITFTPEKDFVGEAKGITVRGTDADGVVIKDKDDKELAGKYIPLVYVQVRYVDPLNGGKVVKDWEKAYDKSKVTDPAAPAHPDFVFLKWTESEIATGQYERSATYRDVIGPVGTPCTSEGYYCKPQTSKLGSEMFTAGDGSLLSYALLDGTVAVTSIEVEGEGIYTIDVSTGVVTFEPDELFFAGAASGVTIVVVDSNDMIATTTYTPTVIFKYQFVDADGTVYRSWTETTDITGEPTIADPSRPGYVFEGWDMSIDGNGWVTFTAQWSYEKKDTGAKTTTKASSATTAKKTGDSDFLLMASLLVAASGAAAVGAGAFARRKKED